MAAGAAEIMNSRIVKNSYRIEVKLYFREKIHQGYLVNLLRYFPKFCICHVRFMFTNIRPNRSAFNSCALLKILMFYGINLSLNRSFVVLLLSKCWRPFKIRETTCF